MKDLIIKDEALERIAQSLEELVKLKELELRMVHGWQKPPSKKKVSLKKFLAEG